MKKKRYSEEQIVKILLEAEKQEKPTLSSANWEASQSKAITVGKRNTAGCPFQM